MSKSLDKAQGALPITVRGKDYLLPIRDIPHHDLRFFNDNPRVYSVLHDGDEEPGQEEIQKHFTDAEFVRNLKMRIEENGGLVEPLYVRELTMEVVEGNSRLAAYRMLAATSPLKWNKVRCCLLPKEIDDSIIMSLLSEFHLNGKKSWEAYEQAALLHRRHKVQEVPLKKLEEETQIKPAELERRIETIQLMIDAKDNHRRRWSYYYEFIKSGKIKQACKNHAGLKTEIVKRIKSGKIPKAEDIRDKLKVIVGSDAGVSQIMAGATIDQAFENTRSSMDDTKALAQLTKFRLWIAQTETKQRIKGAAKSAKAQIKMDLEEIKRHIESLQKPV